MTTENALKRCQEAFKRSGMTLDALADKAGIARTTVNSYMQGGPQHPRDATVKLLAAALGVDASQLPDDDETENASETFMLAHCASCQAETRKHNEALREDFNARHESMRQYYDEHTKEVINHHTDRYNDLKQHSEERVALIREHNAEKINELNAKIKDLTAENASLQRKNKWFMVALILLICIVCILVIIDFARGDLGWMRYSLIGSNSNHSAIGGIIKYLADWLA